MPVTNIVVTQSTETIEMCDEVLFDLFQFRLIDFIAESQIDALTNTSAFQLSHMITDMVKAYHSLTQRRDNDIRKHLNLKADNSLVDGEDLNKEKVYIQSLEEKIASEKWLNGDKEPKSEGTKKGKK